MPASPTLPRPLYDIHISPFPEGADAELRYVVEAGTRSFVVTQPVRVLIEALSESSDPVRVRRSLLEETGVAMSDGELVGAIARLPRALFVESEHTQDNGLLFVPMPILKQAWVAWLATRLQHAYDRRFLIAVALLAAVALPLCFQEMAAPRVLTGVSPLASATLLLALAVSALGHELGHAAACARFGVPPGHIGFGLYVIFPVFYADVTRAWRLAPARRVIVDLGGLYFQTILLLLAAPLFLAGFASEAMYLFFFYNAGAMLHNLSPVFKLDGYWLLADLARIPNLHRRTFAYILHLLHIQRLGADQLQPRLNLILLGYGILVAAYFFYLGAYIPGWLSSHVAPGLVDGAGNFSHALERFAAGAWLDAFGSATKGLLVVLAVGLPILLGLLWVARLAISAFRIFTERKQSPFFP
ncbi:MAG: hypothetical protein HYV95_11645 [Opitutae bacterium]|nr:hypothetical protein [Opitutae bacterium]